MDPYQGGPGSSWLSLVVDLFVLLCIGASIALLPLEFFRPEYEPLVWDLELAFTAIFIVEYGLRWYAAEDRLRYPFTPYAVVDFLAILPTLLVLGAQFFVLRAFRGIRILRLLRLLRAVRLLRVLRYGFLIQRGIVELRIWAGAVIYQYRLRQLFRLLLFVIVAWVVGANVIHLTEARLVGEQGPYAGYWRSYWHIVIVLISGIEDKEPVSLLGRVEVTVLLVAGICMVGMLTGEIVSILVRKVQRAGKVALKPPGDRMEQHIVVLGENDHLDQVLRQVTAALDGRHYLLVVCPEAEELRVTDSRVYRRVFALAGDPTEPRVLEEADIDAASRVIVLAADEDGAAPALTDNRSLMRTLAVVCRERKVPVVTELLTEESLRYAAQLEGVDFVLDRHHGERFLVQAVHYPEAADIFDELLSFTTDSNELYTVVVPEELVGRTFEEAQLHYLDADEEPVVPIGIDRSPEDRPNTRFWLNPASRHGGLPPAERVLSAGDRLIFIAYERPSFCPVAREELWEGRVLLRS